MGPENFNVLHFIVYYDAMECLDTLVKLIVQHGIENPNPLPPGPKTPNHRNRNGLNPLEMAVSLGKINFVERLLQLGALRKPEGVIPESEKQPKDEEEEERVYKGLDIGGRKMDWAVKRKEKSEKVKLTTSAIHIAAFYNQPACIDF